MFVLVIVAVFMYTAPWHVTCRRTHLPSLRTWLSRELHKDRRAARYILLRVLNHTGEIHTYGLSTAFLRMLSPSLALCNFLTLYYAALSLCYCLSFVQKCASQHSLFAIYSKFKFLLAASLRHYIYILTRFFDQYYICMKINLLIY